LAVKQGKMKIKKIGICGCGLMGSGIAEVVAKAGYQGRKTGRGFYDYI